MENQKHTMGGSSSPSCWADRFRIRAERASLVRICLGAGINPKPFTARPTGAIPTGEGGGVGDGDGGFETGTAGVVAEGGSESDHKERRISAEEKDEVVDTGFCC